VYVQESIRSQFVEAFKTTLQGMLSKVGDPLDANTTHGPQVDALQYRHVMRFLESAKADGITAEIGGDKLGGKGYYIQPTILVDASTLLPPTVLTALLTNCRHQRPTMSSRKRSLDRSLFSTPSKTKTRCWRKLTTPSSDSMRVYTLRISTEP
jgi:delta 1-pyrroline-5-carboxylate dehydrogenase